ncbi:Uncharacterized protein TCM_002767 [Theobroma cacao]|uniref:Uncharacterized protein n=1 Tax=Theobroma cacao TaxID=3641 RepID=A0A061DUZ6_THECC|nr:Uncharacterized protein TCM_002767 [Theobroma cacao]
MCSNCITQFMMIYFIVSMYSTLDVYDNNTIFDNGCSQGNRETDSKALRGFGLTFRVISVHQDTAAVVTGSRGVPGRDTF